MIASLCNLINKYKNLQLQSYIDSYLVIIQEMRIFRSLFTSKYIQKLNFRQIHRFSTEEISQLYNPFTKELVSTKQYLTNDELYTKLTMTSVSYKKWKDTPLDNRIDLVSKFVQSIVAQKQKLKPIIAAEIGKSYKNIDEEFKRIQSITSKLIQSGRETLKSQIIQKQQHKLKIVQFEPVGLSLLFPYYSEPLFDSLINLIPCLISGNGALIKTSDFNHFLGPYLQKKSKEVLGRSSLISDVFIHPQQLKILSQFRPLKKVLYSGSQQSAKRIFQVLVNQRFIDCNLFFAGKDAAYVDETADLQYAARQIVKNSFYNNGQSYDCINRLYIAQRVQAQLIQMIKQQIIKIHFGNPEAKETDLGPLCSPENASLAEQFVSQSVSEGASCQIGGLSVSDSSQSAVFFQPTLLNNCTNDMMIVNTPISAPILCIIPMNNQSLLELVNSNEYGTGLRIFTKDYLRYESIVQNVEIGKISFNSGSLFDKNLPIEGWKKSGKGKILSQLSYEEFSIPKSYNIKSF